jgi:hypothetical protein
MDWFRSHHGAPTDPKLRLVAKRCGLRSGDVAAVWWALLDHASQAEDRGSVADFDPEVLAVAFDYPVEDVRRVYETLCNAGLVSERYRLVSWERRQPKREGSSTDRVRKHRAEKKWKNGDETHETNDETQMTPRTEQSRADLKKSARGRASEILNILGKTKRRLTDDERVLAAAVNGGDVPWETTDEEVERWRKRAQARQARKAPPVEPVVTAPPVVVAEPAPPAEVVAPPAADWDIPPALDRRSA